MNFQLNNVPSRTQKPRNNGLTMVMDKGLCVRQAEDLMAVGAAYIDFVKLGWTTAYIIPQLEEKLAVYREAGVHPYFGGTLFEAFTIRNQFDDFLRVLEKYQLEYAEVSDGSITLPHEEKCAYIAKLSQHVTVIS